MLVLYLSFCIQKEYKMVNNLMTILHISDLHFGQEDQQRLLESGVEFVYISIQDHQKYYRMIEESLEEIIADAAGEPVVFVVADDQPQEGALR